MTKNITVDSGAAGKEISQEALQEKLMVFQLMEKQMESMRQQIIMVEQRLVEIETSKAALQEISKLKPGNETLFPMGSGIYVKGTITGKSVMTEVGSSIMKEKPVASAIKYIENRRNDIEKVGMSLEKEIEKISMELQKMAPELQKMASRIREGG